MTCTAYVFGTLNFFGMFCSQIFIMVRGSASLILCLNRTIECVFFSFFDLSLFTNWQFIAYVLLQKKIIVAWSYQARKVIVVWLYAKG